MKNIKQFLGLAIAASLLVVVAASCGSDSPTAAFDKNKNMLTANTWSLQSLTVDGVDETALYPGMTLSFTATTYATTHGEPVWPASGTWAFVNDAMTILRDGTIEIKIESIAADKVVLSLVWAPGTFGSGRTASVAGNHIYTFVK